VSREPIRVTVTRGGHLESVHRVQACLVRPGEPDLRIGDEPIEAFWRSAMKPFQTLPLVEDGAADAYDFDPKNIALASASHYGTPEHVRRVREMLQRLELGEEALICGPHAPYHERSAHDLIAAGSEPSRLHNNCSGKHAGMLALARHHGWATARYTEMAHPVQVRIQQELARWLDSDADVLLWGLDGCGVPTPRLDLSQMARAYARLVSSDSIGARTVVAAMTTFPELTSGPGALPTRLMQVTAGRLLAKEGAEAVFCVASVPEHWALALKVEDGGKRAVAPAVLGLLAWCGFLTEREAAELEALAHPQLRNTEGKMIGTIEVSIPEETGQGTVAS